MSNAPIGVFDSGVGGLTVLKALTAKLPRENFVYLGDTARLPYGTKSPETVARYSVQAAQALTEYGVKCLVIACNTASSAGLHAIRERIENVPVIGVIEPGAQAACAASRTGNIAVIATEGTVRGGAYQRAILRIRPEGPGYCRARPAVCSTGGRGAERGLHRERHRKALPEADVRGGDNFSRHAGARVHPFPDAGRCNSRRYRAQGEDCRLCGNDSRECRRAAAEGGSCQNYGRRGGRYGYSLPTVASDSQGWGVVSSSDPSRRTRSSWLTCSRTDLQAATSGVADHTGDHLSAADCVVRRHSGNG